MLLAVHFFIFTFMRTILRVFFSSFPFSTRSAGTITAYLVSAMLYTTVINIIITKTQRLETVRRRKPSLQKKIRKLWSKVRKAWVVSFWSCFWHPGHSYLYKIQILGRTSNYLMRFFTLEFDKDEKLNSYQRQIKNSWKPSIL